MNTLFEKIWNAHIVQNINDGPTQLYIDRFYCHQVTSPQALNGWKKDENGNNTYIIDATVEKYIDCINKFKIN